MNSFKQILAHFYQRSDGSIAITFALALIPIMVGVGAAIDYSRANSVKSFLQASMDAAVLTGAKDGSSTWNTVALNNFTGNIASKNITASTPIFKVNTDGAYSGSATATVPTTILGVIHIPTISVSVSAAAAASEPDNSCILTLDRGQLPSHVSLTLNGAPVINLSNCSIRSNTSLDCNGHDGSVTKAIASGTSAGCTNPKSNASVIPDIYAPLASNITAKCGGLRPGVTWVPGSTPVGSGIVTVNTGSYVEYHICGDLTLSGSGYLTGATPAVDSIIIIENGSLNIDDRANINTVRTSIILTGNNNFSSQINFPNGNGKAATLSLSPPNSAANPWQGVALYQDPILTRSVDDTWGPGAALNADGLVYLPNANVVTDGNTASNNSQCSKFVMNRFTTNGRVNLNFAQSTNNCAAIGLKQWAGVIVHLTQ